jgi:segregation and condensation protein B
MEEEKQQEAAEQQPPKDVFAEEPLAQEPSRGPAGDVGDPRSPVEGLNQPASAADDAGAAEREDEPAEEASIPDERGPSVLEEGTLDDDGAFPADESPREASINEASINAFELIGSTEDQATAAETDAATLKAVLEAIVYVLPEPVPAAQMAAALNQPLERVENILRELMEDTARPERGVFIREVAGGYQVATKPEHHEAIRNFVKNLKQPLKLSGAALETLAVIAYKQPVTAPEILEIRGVQGVGVLKTLLDRKLITTAGRKNVIGKPILYKTTKEFLTQFGLNRVSELPTLKEFEEIRRQSISDDEIEGRPEAHPSAPLLQQAAALEEMDYDTEDSVSSEAHSADTPSGEPLEGTQEHVDAPPDEDGAPSETVLEPEPHAEAGPKAEADPQSEAPPTPESGPESQENHG